MRYLLEKKEKKNLVPTDIVYEPSFDESAPVQCFFTDRTFLAYRSYFGIMGKNEQEKISHRTAQQCYYCGNFIAKNSNNKKKVILEDAVDRKVLLILSTGNVPLTFFLLKNNNWG